MTLVRILMSPASQTLIDKHQSRSADLHAAITAGLKQSLEEVGAHLQHTYLRGGSRNTPRGGSTPLAVGTGALLGSIATDIDLPPFSGYVGSREGPASAYARVQLQAGSTTIRPKAAKHLWIPLKDNRDPRGLARFSPRDLMGMTNTKGKRRLQIFKSKNGNLIAFLPDANGGTYTRGKNKGRLRGTLMFVLKDSVTVQGTDALAKVAQDRSPRISQVISQHLRRAINGDQA